MSLEDMMQGEGQRIPIEDVPARGLRHAERHNALGDQPGLSHPESRESFHANSGLQSALPVLPATSDCPTEPTTCETAAGPRHADLCAGIGRRSRRRSQWVAHAHLRPELLCYSR